MTRRSIRGGAAAVAVALVAACITVNIYFPEATVKKTAEEIVEEIRRSEPPKEGTAALPAFLSCPRSRAFGLVPAAYAQEATTVSTPAIRALKEEMKKRFADLKPCFEAGQIGEDAKGLVDIRDEAGLGLQAKAALRKLVKAENEDRTRLYAEVAQALDIEASQVLRVQRIFAASWIASAAPGWWVQQEDGRWVRKPAS